MKKICFIFLSLYIVLSSCTEDSDTVNNDLVNDTEAPSVPTDLSSSNIKGASVDLSWSASTDNVGVTNYKVYQDGNEIAQVTGTSYAVTGLEGSTTYLFTVSAVDKEGNESAESSTITLTTATPTDTVAPSQPQNLIASNTTVVSTELSWQASTDNIVVKNYKIYQNGSEIAQVVGTTYFVTDLNGSTMYSFTVSAIDEEGNESVESSAETITTLTATDSEPPSVPTNLFSSNITQVSVDLSWSASTDNVGVAFYKVYQGGNNIAQVMGAMYAVGDLNASTTYSFTVSAVDTQGNESSQSSAESVTTSTATSRPKVLVFTKTAGFNHRTESESVAMVQQIASNQDFDVVADNDGSEFNTLTNLNQYDVIFFSNTSGNTLTAAQRSNVESYAAQGGNFISNHAASDSYGHSTASTVSGNGKGEWDWYAEYVTGCSVRNNPNHTSNNFGATVTVQNANAQLTTGISFPWSDNEEWYYWEGGYINNSFIELLRVSDTGSNSYDNPRMTAHYWQRPDSGISFYTSMGHSESKYTDADFVQLIDNAFDFILN